MSGVRTFIDSNILVYVFTENEPEKRDIALEYLGNCLPVMSTQVIRELSNVLLNKASVSPQIVRETIEEVVLVADVVDEDTQMILASLNLHEKYKYSFYDSLIISAALRRGCTVLLSEDMQDGQIIEDSLKIVNPFRGAFKASL